MPTSSSGPLELSQHTFQIMLIIRLQTKSVHFFSQFVEIVQATQLFQSGRIVGQQDKLFGILRPQPAGAQDPFDVVGFLRVQVWVIGIKVIQ
ncbi:hypothetical protein DW852_07230 [Bifidobacterium pseudocatenulatum]|nr:hypothetical protein DW852_07230 [Bifidobacterium pseudocatenulatum]RHC34825.1 hypothetical protein DW847_07215 [Bifidobacterium pseudocatenulatum]